MRKSILVLITFSFVTMITGLTFAAEKQIAAVVNGDNITIEEINRTVQALPQYQKLQLEILEDMIVKTLIYQESVKAGIKVEKDDIEKGFKEFISKYSMDEAAIKKEMKRMNVSEDLMKEELAKQLMVERFLKKRAKGLDLSVSDEEVKKFYDERPETFNKPERVSASHILIKCGPTAEKAQIDEANKKITDIKKKLDKGEDFAALAKQYSEDPVTAEKGGALNSEITRKSPLPKSFIDAAFALAKNETSDPVKSVVGFHLIKVTDKKPAAQTPFSEIKESLKYRLMERKSAFEMKQYVDSLVEKSDIKILLEKRKRPSAN